MEEETIEGAFDGPRRLVHDGATTRWTVTPARATAELEAHARLAGHPLAIANLRREGDTLVFPRSRPLRDIDQALDAIRLASGHRSETETSVRAWFHALGGPVDAVRGLGRAGLPRSLVDRFLARTLRFTTSRGPDLGGVMPGSLRVIGDRPVALSVRHGRPDGWPVIDLASLALRADLDLAEDGDAFALALVHEAIRELASVRDEDGRSALREGAREIVERVVARAPHGRRKVFAFEPKRVRRERLFSRFFEGIVFDDEGLFSATPEAIANRIAAGLEGVVVDATCGIGSIAIALARSPGVTRVIAIDADAKRLEMAAHNAAIYGVADRIDFRSGDALAIVPTLRRIDALVIDPPWGGRDYDRRSITLDDLPMPIAPLLALGCAIVLKLPRSFDVGTLPPGFAIEPAIDERGVLKMLIARRGVRSTER